MRLRGRPVQACGLLHGYGWKSMTIIDRSFGFYMGPFCLDGSCATVLITASHTSITLTCSNATACSVLDGLIKMSGRDAGMNTSREVSERPGWVLPSGALSHGLTVFHDTSTAAGPLETKADKAADVPLLLLFI